MWNLFLFILKVVLYFITMASLNSKAPAAAKLEDLSVPEVSETKSIAVGWGTFKQKSSNLIWYGNLSTSEIKEEVGNFLMSQDVVVGYRYYLSQWYGLSHGEVSLKRIFMDDKLIWENTGETGIFTGSYRTEDGLFMNEDEYFQAQFDFYPGIDTQPQNQHLVDNDVDAPSYPNISHVVFRLGDRGAIVGNSLNLRPLAFECERFPLFDELDNQKVNINGDCNPIFILYDILTANKYGLGLRKDLIDIDNFNEVADTLFNEGFGLSLIYEDKFRCDEFVDQIMRHISANFVEDTVTGKLKVKLLRDDYDEETIPVFNESNVVEVDSFDRTTKNELYNEVKVKYTNAENNYNEAYSIWQNLGLDFTDRAAAQRSVSLDFPWITKPDLAGKVAEREATPVSYVLSTLQIKAHRLNGLEVGDVFKFEWDKYNIAGIVYRIQSINYGNINTNTMTINAIQDAFTINQSSYGQNGNNKFEEVNILPKSMNLQFMECPYFFSNTLNNLVYYPLRNDGSSKYYQVYTKEDGETEYKLTSNKYLFSDIINTNELLTVNATSVDIVSSFLPISNSNSEQQKTGKNLLLLVDNLTGEHEFISFTKVTGDEINGYTNISNLKRGCLDTLPREWGVNTAMYFIQNGISLNVDLLENENIDMKAVATTASGTYSLDLAAEINYTMNAQQRNLKPILGGFYKCNNQDVVVDNIVNLGDVDIDIDWLFKNIENQNEVSGYYQGESSNTSNTNYVINIYDNSNNTLIKNVITQDNNYIFDDETVLNPSRYNDLRIEINSELNTYTSLNTLIFYVQRP